MITGKTSDGFEFKIEEDALDDYEILEALVDIDNGKTGSITFVVDKLLGAEQKDALKAHLRALHGKVGVKAMVDSVVQIFAACKEGKNS